MKLQDIQNRANDKKETIENLKYQNDKLDKKIKEIEKEISKQQTDVAQLQAKEEQLKNNKKDITEDSQYQRLIQEKEQINQDIESLKADVQEQKAKVEYELGQLENDLHDKQNDYMKFQRSEQSQQRLKELEQEEKELSKEYERLERDEFLIEEYTRSKVNLVEERINKKFKFARFKLFEEQQNGGLKETCETVYHGVPFNHGLNNAAQINVGLDVINTLNEHYGVQAPIFIDNSESVTELIEIDTQVIQLVVSDKHKTLTSEAIA